jgi:hypothetical protein
MATRRRRPRRVPIARRNLLAEKTRLLMSIGGVAFAVLLILLVTSLYRGWSEAGGEDGRGATDGPRTT